MSMTITEKILDQHAGLKEVFENKTTSKKFQARLFPPFMQDLIQAGGLLIPYVKGRSKNA